LFLALLRLAAALAALLAITLLGHLIDLLLSLLDRLIKLLRVVLALLDLIQELLQLLKVLVIVLVRHRPVSCPPLLGAQDNSLRPGNVPPLPHRRLVRGVFRLGPPRGLVGAHFLFVFLAPLFLVTGVSFAPRSSQQEPAPPAFSLGEKNAGFLLFSHRNAPTKIIGRSLARLRPMFTNQ